ncbi:ABC transporter ATP-binding protein [Thalassospira mesophila]|uniref:ABC transporter ATP-binding protein n=1 Tax=Thalassospira mesophila TaxID=1293891 RepID=A0A1Y2KYZ8_9PROT|nr:sn-glycerol-3-phosphate ABC transporter ATP-binding protein UgpC [Thalassospira mesophila]OSQ36437.1 ABC transporter ATP-binding protein [Thalassospira mesophila]
MTNLSLQAVKKAFGPVEVLHGIDLEIAAGEFVVFVGPSGCGKSTMLRLIAGLEEITSGTLEIGGEIANSLPPAERGIAMVFQSYALYPHMTVYDNMAFGLKISGMAKPEIDQRVRRAADMLQLTPYLDRHPKKLSGGQRQRVAIGRAVTRDPKVFLFDEPLSNLDAALRVATRIEIANLKEAMPDATMVYVTHDQVEAMTLADRIVVFNDGHIEQVGTPLELYTQPANLFVARFIGSPAMNIIPFDVLKGGDRPALLIKGVSETVVSLGPDDKICAGGTGYLGIRPEHLRVARDGDMALEGAVLVSERLGELTNIHLDIGQDDPLIIKVPGMIAPRRGEKMKVTFDRENIHLFEAEGLAV